MYVCTYINHSSKYWKRIYNWKIHIHTHIHICIHIYMEDRQTYHEFWILNQILNAILWEDWIYLLKYSLFSCNISPRGVTLWFLHHPMFSLFRPCLNNHVIHISVCNYIYIISANSLLYIEPQSYSKYLVPLCLQYFLLLFCDVSWVLVVGVEF